MTTMNPIRNHEGQRRIWHDEARFKFLVAGRRWGKTLLIREQLLFHSDRPKSTIIYVAPTRFQAKDIIWPSLKDRLRNLGWKVRINESELKITRANKSTIELKSAEKPGRLRGRAINFIALDEYAEYRSDEIWREVIRPALADTRGKALFAMTPKGFNHAYDLYQNAKTDKDWAAYTYRTVDSPIFQTEDGKAEIENARRTLSERDFRQEFEASFENYAGRIYYSFDRTIHNTSLQFDKAKRFIVGQDFNRSPMSSCIFQRKNDGRLAQVDELFLQSSNTDEVCRIIKERYGSNGVFRPDATGNRRTSNSSVSDHQIIRSHGFTIEVSKTNPRRVDRWNTVNTAYEKGNVLINVAKCPKTVKDLETLCYKEGACEPMLTDPMAGHLADAHDYAIYKEFPIIGKIRQSFYA